MSKPIFVVSTPMMLRAEDRVRSQENLTSRLPDWNVILVCGMTDRFECRAYSAQNATEIEISELRAQIVEGMMGQFAELERLKKENDELMQQLLKWKKEQ